MSERLSQGRTVQGTVVSDSKKRRNTITVRVERKVKHPLYGKIMTRSTKFHAHDPEERCVTGDLVIIKECKPISKTKSWELLERLEKIEREVL
jgi:small subunit ribosomal protein S17